MFKGGMKHKVVYNNKFKKQYKNIYKINKKITLELDNIIGMLMIGVGLPEKYKNHRLHGKLSNCYECHVKSDWLLIYEKDQDRLILTLVRTGTHSELFN